MLTELSVRGPFRGYSGHDITVRSFVRGLLAAGVKVSLVDMPHWSSAKLRGSQRDARFEGLAGDGPVDISLQFCMPHQVDPARSRRTVNFTMFEAHPAPRTWGQIAGRLDLTVLPTRSSFDAWIAAGAPESRLRLCPLGVDGERYRPGLAPLPLEDRRGKPIAEYAVRILNVSDVVPRKNLLGLMRVWLTATSSEDDAILLLKLSHGRLSSVRLMRDLKRLEQSLGRSRTEAASMLIFDDVLSDAEMPRLFATATHYWSMSCGEGWDQPMTEAGAVGLRLIAPDHTGYRTYLTPEVATLVPARPEPVPSIDNPDIRAFFEGSEWMRPDEDAAAECVLRAVRGTDTPLSARERLVSEFDWDRAVARLIDILGELKPERPALRRRPLWRSLDWISRRWP